MQVLIISSSKILGIYKDVFNNDIFESISDYTYAKNNSAKLVRFSAELLKEVISKPELKIKTWHVMPRPSNNMLFVPLSGAHAMHGVLERCFNAGLKISQQVYTEEYSFEERRLCALLTVAVTQYIPALMGPTSFEDHYGDVVWKNHLWETLFNLDHIQKKRSSASQGSQPCARLNYGWKTDGHIVIILFIKKAIEQIPQDDSEMNFMKRKVNLTIWRKGLYPLKKEPTGIMLNDRIIGQNPGLRDIFAATDCSASEIVDKDTVKEKTTKFSNAEYKMRSGFECEIPTVGSVNSNELLKYLRVIGRNREKIFDFMKGYRHRETKAYLVQNRKATDNHMCDLVLGQTAAGAPYTLAHRTSSKKRRKAKNMFKKASGIVAKETKRTVIAYGDASLTGTKAGYTLIPVKKVQRALAQRALVIPVDEFRTSVNCSKCHRRLENKYERQKLVCNHKKKKVRLRGEKKMLLYDVWTMTRGLFVVHRSAHKENPAVSYPPVMYQLKHCHLCPAVNDRDIVWQRDVNAALNIRSILMSYIESNYSILSRHPSLKREPTSGGYQATSQPL
ncbi:uncharacterized protein RHIMIDRAFT_315546 [Rhizopus microsporus ATCC 52813]|uniref:Uncharacterized protein n=1 Tax=Rhizopus microsporus ATCC 52813 TaxID=1340429 RepID=A0A2G4SKI9_RHIZD|nr:uncharacterized protein RHIMIDRAFT_315546 [Rhizopus microsporus ATCC 52813]PHZ09297.1 hypothetical protein RHIMIDRAFT_315546 [Rhizopus microsporus ATCC 52813]